MEEGDHSDKTIEPIWSSTAYTRWDAACPADTFPASQNQAPSDEGPGGIVASTDMQSRETVGYFYAVAGDPRPDVKCVSSDRDLSQPRKSWRRSVSLYRRPKVVQARR